MSFLRRLVPAAIRRRYTVKFTIVLLCLGLMVGLIGFAATVVVTDEVEDRVEADQLSHRTGRTGSTTVARPERTNGGDARHVGRRRE